MNRKKYYYEITDAAGEVMYMEIDAKPKDPKLLCEFFAYRRHCAGNHETGILRIDGSIIFRSTGKRRKV